MAMQCTEPTAPATSAPSQIPHWSKTISGPMLRVKLTRILYSLFHRSNGGATLQETPGADVSNIISCHHCSSPLPAAALANSEEIFCCSGCRNAHSFIVTSGLSDYYEVLSSCKAKAPIRAPEADQTSDTELAKHLAQPAVRHLFERTDSQGNPEWVFFIPSLRCAACDWIIRRALLADARIHDAMVSLATLRVVVRPSVTGERRWDAFESAVQVLQRLGYRPFPPTSESSGDSVVQVQRAAWKRTAFAAICFGNTMLFAAAVYFGERAGMEPGFERLFALLSLALTLPCLVFSGRAFLDATARALNPKRFQLSIDFPIGLAMIAGVVLSGWHAFFGDARQVYFDSICGLIFFLNLGRSFQGSLLFRLQRAIARPQDLLPAGAFALTEGDIVTVAAGTVIPADGIVTRGQAEVDESFLTGESSPLLRSAGNQVFAGSQIVTGQIDLKAQRTGLATHIGSLSRATLAALEKPTTRLNTLQKATPFLTLFILIAGIIGFCVVGSNGNILGGFERMLATLIVGCPCAFGLGIPLAYARAAQAAAKIGIIVTDMQALESLASCDKLLLDKTGTLTTGQLKLRAFVPINGECAAIGLAPDGAEPEALASHVPLAALLALREGVRRSHHPISRAVFNSHLLSDLGLSKLGDPIPDLEITHFAEEPGKGIRWSVDFPRAGGRQSYDFRLGSWSYITEKCGDTAALTSVCFEMPPVKIEEKAHAVYAKKVHKGGVDEVNRVISKQTLTSCFFYSQQHGVFLAVLQDELRPEVASSIVQLQNLGMDVSMLTGDHRDTALGVAAEAGIASENVDAEVTPEAKAQRVAVLQNAGHRVALAGDGINDATALASATAGLVFSSGSALSQRAAGLCLTQKNFGPIADAVLLSQRLGRTVTAMLCFSVCYNLTTVSLAIGGHITPLLAAVLMPASSLLVAVIARGAGRI